MSFDKSRNMVRELISQTVIGTSPVDYAARDSAMATGRMYRPMMLMSIAQGYGVPLEKSVKAAAALEMGNAASLILDDIADKSETRRRQTSCWKIYGEGIATMAALKLIFQAEIMAGYCYEDPSTCLEVSRIMNAGALRTLEGQVADVASTIDLSPVEIEKIAEKKTGALFEVAASIGAAVANGRVPSEHDGLWGPFGKKVGICYQIGDDIYDINGDPKEGGKPINMDVNKPNLARKIGVEPAMIRQREYLDAAHASINYACGTDFDARPIRKLLEEMFPEIK